jgi:hypothetical protein
MTISKKKYKTKQKHISVYIGFAKDFDSAMRNDAFLNLMK